jgi:hypothetical protein
MLDFRAWIIAGVILLSAAGAYVVWITRPRAMLTGRSLTAAQRSANSLSPSATRALHVEGCNDDFIVKPGELVEPRVVPGSSLDQFRSVYGQETTREESASSTWEQNAFTLTDSSSSAASPEAAVHVSLHQGHVLETLDGIELGIDSFGAIFRKMRDRKIEVHERMQNTDNGWTLIVSLYSSCSRKFRSEYSRTLPHTPEVDKLITPQPPSPNGNPGVTPALWRSDVFMNKIVSEYSLIPSNGHDESPEGSPAEHN